MSARMPRSRPHATEPSHATAAGCRASHPPARRARAARERSSRAQRAARRVRDAAAKSNSALPCEATTPCPPAKPCSPAKAWPAAPPNPDPAPAAPGGGAVAGSTTAKCADERARPFGDMVYVLAVSGQQGRAVSGQQGRAVSGQQGRAVSGQQGRAVSGQHGRQESGGAGIFPPAEARALCSDDRVGAEAEAGQDSVAEGGADQMSAAEGSVPPPSSGAVSLCVVRERASSSASRLDRSSACADANAGQDACKLAASSARASSRPSASDGGRGGAKGGARLATGSALLRKARPHVLLHRPQLGGRGKSTAEQQAPRTQEERLPAAAVACRNAKGGRIPPTLAVALPRAPAADAPKRLPGIESHRVLTAPLGAPPRLRRPKLRRHSRAGSQGHNQYRQPLEQVGRRRVGRPDCALPAKAGAGRIARRIPPSPTPATAGAIPAKMSRATATAGRVPAKSSRALALTPGSLGRAPYPLPHRRQPRRRAGGVAAARPHSRRRRPVVKRKSDGLRGCGKLSRRLIVEIDERGGRGGARGVVGVRRPSPPGAGEGDPRGKE
eukprot:scaffold12967_cov120-Isochrysis_galbana.AAC.11